MGLRDVFPPFLSRPGPWLRLARFSTGSCFPRPRFRRISRLLRHRQQPRPRPAVC